MAIWMKISERWGKGVVKSTATKAITVNKPTTGATKVLRRMDTTEISPERKMMYGAHATPAAADIESTSAIDGARYCDNHRSSEGAIKINEEVASTERTKPGSNP
jgi:hypothetical protein